MVQIYILITCLSIWREKVFYSQYSHCCYEAEEASVASVRCLARTTAGGQVVGFISQRYRYQVSIQHATLLRLWVIMVISSAEARLSGRTLCSRTLVVIFYDVGATGKQQCFLMVFFFCKNVTLQYWYM